MSKLKFPIDEDIFLKIVRKNGGDDNMAEIALAICSIANRAYKQGVKDGRNEVAK